MKKSRHILFAAAVALTVVFAGCGKDDAPNPVTYIYTNVQLDSVRYNLSGNYMLMYDISLANYSAGEGWLPIGTYEAPFTGKFNGNGHKITNLAINRPDESYVGLFGYIKGGSVRALGVEIGAGGVGGIDAGGIAGEINKGTIIDCYSMGNIYGGSSGGIVGDACGSAITNCYSAGNIYSTDGYAGGIAAGIFYGSKISNCYSTGDISGYASGGIVGWGPEVVKNYNYNYDNNGIVTNCYSAGNISGNTSGGIVGAVIYDWIITITNCAAINPTIDADYPGRIVGFYIDVSNPSNNFALDVMTATGAGKFNTTNTWYHSVSKTDAQLRTQSTYSAAVNGDGLGGLGWKFGNNDANPWKMPAGGGYPILYWQ